MGGKFAKSNDENCDYKSQRIFLCEHCYEKNNINDDSSTCGTCGNINLNVCFYPFSEPIIPVEMKPRKQLFRDSFESLYANINCCGIIKRADEKSLGFEEQKLPPNITGDNLLTSDLAGQSIPTLQIQQRFPWLALLNNKKQDASDERTLSIEHDIDSLKTYEGPTPSIKHDIDSIATERDPVSCVMLDKSSSPLQEIPITCTKQEVATSISQEELSRMSIQVEMGNNNENANSQLGADSITIKIGPQEMDCFDDWENVSEFMIDFPSLDNEFQSPINMSKINSGVTLSSSRNWTFKEPNHCIMKIVNGNDIHIIVEENVKEIHKIEKVEEMENYCEENLQDGILAAAATNNKKNLEISDSTMILNSFSRRKQADCEDVLDAQRKRPYHVTEDILFKQKLLTNDVNRFMLPSITNDESFFRISFNEHDNSLNDDPSLTMWTSSFESILQLCHCKQKILDVEVYNFGAQKDVNLVSYPQTYIASNTTKTQMELNIPESINEKDEKNYFTDQDDIALSKNIPLQLQGAFPNEGTAFFTVTNLMETSQTENNAHSQQFVKFTVSKSSLSLFDEKYDFNTVKKIFVLVENIIDDLLRYFSVEIIQEFKKIGNTWLLDIFMAIIRDLKTAGYIIKLLKDMPYKLMRDGNYLVKVQKILAKVINGLENIEKQKLCNPKIVESKELRHSLYDLNMDVFESLKPSVNTLPIKRRNSEPLLLEVTSAI